MSADAISRKRMKTRSQARQEEHQQQHEESQRQPQQSHQKSGSVVELIVPEVQSNVSAHESPDASEGMKKKKSSRKGAQNAAHKPEKQKSKKHQQKKVFSLQELSTMAHQGGVQSAAGARAFMQSTFCKPEQRRLATAIWTILIQKVQSENRRRILLRDVISILALMNALQRELEHLKKVI